MGLCESVQSVNILVGVFRVDKGGDGVLINYFKLWHYVPVAIQAALIMLILSDLELKGLLLLFEHCVGCNWNDQKLIIKAVTIS